MTTPLVMLGASLGGLDALTAVLGSLPKAPPAAFVVVQHRRPDSTGLAPLLQRRCRIEVREAQDKDRLTKGKVFVAPADYHLLIEGDTLALSVDAPVARARPSIDVLFESAVDGSPRALVAILLTAASEDGARGLAEVARAGGLTIVQDPEEAQSAVAIRAALARTPVDYVLRLSKIAPCVMSLLTSGQTAAEPKAGYAQRG